MTESWRKPSSLEHGFMQYCWVVKRITFSGTILLPTLAIVRHRHEKAFPEMQEYGLWLTMCDEEYRIIPCDRPLAPSQEEWDEETKAVTTEDMIDMIHGAIMAEGVPLEDLEEMIRSLGGGK